MLTLIAPLVFTHTALSGDIRPHLAFPSRELKMARDMWVYLPKEYATEPKRRFPVLYLGDGQNVFDGSTAYIKGKEWRVDESLTSLVEAKLIPPLIVVAIANGGVERSNEYLPTRAKMGNSETGGKLPEFGRWLIGEVKPFIDQTYRTEKGPDHTAIGGSSFGGIMALWLALEHPTIFGKAAVFSPSVWWDSRSILKTVSQLAPKLRSKLYIDVGTAESTTMERDARDLLSALSLKGWTPGKDVTLVVEQGGKHDEDAWARRFPIMLSFLFGQ